MKKDNLELVKKRIIDVESYLKDSELPQELIKDCLRIIDKFKEVTRLESSKKR